MTQSTTSTETAGLTSSVVVAHVVLNLEIGGLERVVVNMVRHLRGSPFKPIVVCLEEGGFFAQEVKSMGIPVLTLCRTPGISWTAMRQMARLFRKYSVKIVHTHDSAPHLHGMIAALMAGVPVRVHTRHGRNIPDKWRRVWVNRISTWMTDVVVAVSDDVRDVVVRMEQANPRKVQRIWNGVDIEIYKPNVQRSSINAQHPAIGTVARLSPEKDQKTMLAAFRLVLDEFSEARLVICGDGPCGAELRDSASKLGIAGSVSFLGERSDIKEVLHTFDLFTLSSISEGLSMTILEAMASGLPVVATDVGGNREIVNPPECGLVVPPQNPRALADAWIELLRDPVISTHKRDAARVRAVSHFSLEKMMAEYSRLYESLLARKTAP